MAQGKLRKKRSVECYQRKVNKMTKQWEHSKKLQEKMPLSQWLKVIKQPSKGD